MAMPIPLNAVRAIETVARRGTLASAAEELGVTAGAVSQHLRRAEERLGLALFERTPAGLVPTEALRAVLPQLGAGFAQLEEAVRGLKRRGDNVLTLTVGSVFASRWLVWRLGRFTERHPRIDLRLVVTGRLIDFTHDDVDCGIRFGAGRWPGVDAVPIGRARVVAVCASRLAQRLSAPSDLATVPVIEDTSSMLSWAEWFAAAGVVPAPGTAGPRFNDPALAFDAAISGHGVLLAVEMMAADALRDGRLVQPFGTVAETPLCYWFVTPAGRRPAQKVREFRDWLLDAAA